MLFVSIANLLFPDAIFIQTNIKIITQIITGTYIGQTIEKSNLAEMKKMGLPVFILISSYLVFTLVMGLLLNKVFSIDLATAFLVSVPGGVVDMSLISFELGGNPSIVSIFQTFRLVFVLSVFPIVIKKLSGKVHGLSPKLEISNLAVKKNQMNISVQLMTLVVGSIGGLFGYFLGIPAGALSFSLLVTILLKLKTRKVSLSINFRKFAQIAAGALIGSSFNRADLVNLKSLVIPVIVLLVGYSIACLVIAKMIEKTKRVDLITALFASSPGGASDMALIASEIDCDPSKIVIIQISRLTLVIILFPIYVQMLLHIFSS